MKKRFISGQLILVRDTNEDYVARLQEEKDDIFSELVDWAYAYDVFFQFGITESNNYVCEYRIVANSASMCKSILRELKDIIKPIANKKVELGYEMSGSCW